MTVEELHDEVAALDAIYPGSVKELGPHIYQLAVPNHAVQLQMSFPESYPDETPQILQVHTTDPIFTDTKYLERSFGEALEKVFVPGEVVVFEMFTELDQFLERYVDERKEEESNRPKRESPEPVKARPMDEATAPASPPAKAVDALSGWTQSDPIVDRGSTFIAFAREAHSVEEAQGYLDVLVTDRKIARSAHNMSAWRIKKDNGVQYQDCDDDGESAAGGRMLHLLTVRGRFMTTLLTQMMDAWNVIVVVSRWFGGVHIGPDRFKHINSATRDALVRGGFVEVKKRR